MPREVFYTWQRYALGTTTCHEHSAIHDMWDWLYCIMNKHRMVYSMKVQTGNFQGWPGTSDTAIHLLASTTVQRLQKTLTIAQQRNAFGIE